MESRGNVEEVDRGKGVQCSARRVAQDEEEGEEEKEANAERNPSELM